MVELSQKLPEQPYLVEDLRVSVPAPSKWKPVFNQGFEGVDDNISSVKKEEVEEEPGSISNFVKKLADQHKFKLKTTNTSRQTISTDNMIINNKTNFSIVNSATTLNIEEKPMICVVDSSIQNAVTIGTRKRSTSSSSSNSKLSGDGLAETSSSLVFDINSISTIGTNSYEQKKAEMELNAQKLLQLKLLQYQQSNAMLVQNITTLNLLSQQQILQGGSSSTIVSPNSARLEILLETFILFAVSVNQIVS